MMLGCDVPVAPWLALGGAPPLRPFLIDDFYLRDGGVFALTTSPEDTMLRLPRGAYLPVEVWTSRGDVEELRLARMMCGRYTCHRVTVNMKPGSSVRPLESLIQSLGARLVLVSIQSPPGWGSVWVLDGTADRFREWISLHPDVDFAELTAPFTTEPLPPDWNRFLSGGVPIADVPVRQRDGTLSVTGGDTIYFSYTDAEGGVVAANWYVPTLAR
jgi:hypothetical protein